MKVIAQEKEVAFLRFDKGEDILQELTAYTTSQQLTGATFSIIGAAKKVVLSYYNLVEQKYEDHTIDEEVEITGVIGNIGWIGQDVIIHAHGTFADKNLQVKGGHIKSLIISATGEVILQKLNTKLTREFDEETGLNLLK